MEKSLTLDELSLLCDIKDNNGMPIDSMHNDIELMDSLISKGMLSITQYANGDFAHTTNAGNLVVRMIRTNKISSYYG